MKFSSTLNVHLVCQTYPTLLLIALHLDEENPDDDIDPSAGRFVHYHFPSSFLKLKQVGALYVL